MVCLPRSAWCGVTTTVTIVTTLANNMRVDRRQCRLDNDCMMQVSQADGWMVTGMIPWDDYQDDHWDDPWDDPWDDSWDGHLVEPELEPSHEPEADPRGEAISGRGGVGTRS